ncbi:MAG: dTDP-4-dehydrorhamnose 3,5-epimerase [Candidatus ainarchaeum sp.]|nr:dTDP-4-dehydrorhamnose 3,5-epimerase [Candidatus ainarchaeum sp.]
MAEAKIGVKELGGGALLLKAFEKADARGDFRKYFERSLLERLSFSVDEVFISANRKGVFRGMHYQEPCPQKKIVWCVKGKVFDVLLDMRKSSPGCGKWVGVELSQANGKGVYIPEGFAHGFLSLEEDSRVLYVISGEQKPECERGVKYDDPEVGIKLPDAGVKVILSERDAGFPGFSEAVKR